jgi:hypothetical protein
MAASREFRRQGGPDNEVVARHQAIARHRSCDPSQTLAPAKASSLVCRADVQAALVVGGGGGEDLTSAPAHT